MIGILFIRFETQVCGLHSYDSSRKKKDAVEIFKREYPNGLICRGIRRGDFKLIPFREFSSRDIWEEIAS